MADKEAPKVTATDPVEMPWNDDFPNANNERVRLRLTREKEQLLQRAKSAGPVKGSRRAGSILNPEDLSNGGMGGDYGDHNVVRERGVIEDAAQHEAANRIAEGIQVASQATVTPQGWGKPLGAAQAGQSTLLGDDTRPGLDGQAGNPDTAQTRADQA